MTQAQTAAAAASATSRASGPDLAGQYLTFLLGEETFALDIRSVREILQYCPMTSVPLMPHYVRGVINLRGAVVPVLDLQARFGREAAPVGKKSCIVIFECLRDHGRVELGLLVDAVSAVLDIAADSIEPPPHFGPSGRRDFIRGMGKRDGRFLIILDPDKAFEADEIADLCTTNQALRPQ